MRPAIARLITILIQAMLMYGNTPEMSRRVSRGSIDRNQIK